MLPSASLSLSFNEKSNLACVSSENDMPSPSRDRMPILTNLTTLGKCKF